MDNFDRSRHNAEAKKVWAAFNAGRPTRPPMVLGTSTQFFMFSDELNPGEQVTFETYSTDGQVMLDFQLRAAAWRIEHITPYCDDPVELPEFFTVKVDLQTYDEAAYFGAPVVFLPHQVPDTTPILEGDRKHALFDAGFPDPLRGGWYARAHELCAQMAETLQRRPDYLGRPVKMEPFGHYTEGPLTLAIALRGPELLTDLYEDPAYVQQLLDYLVEATIRRIHAHRRFFGLEALSPDLFFADDSVGLISGKMLRDFLLPAYRKLKAGLTTADRVKIHLCGNSTRLFKILRDEVGVYEFETGFPVDFGWLRQELGPEVLIHGGPDIMLLRDGTPESVAAETRRILNSGICSGGRFVLREGNNLAPGTPRANLAAMYAAAQGFEIDQ